LGLAECLDGLVISPADADFIAGDALDVVRVGKALASFEGAGEGVVFEARDAEEPPPVVADEFYLLVLGLGLRVPFLAEAGEEVVEVFDGFGG
jgi:hypothetical protein